jgi:hypothetical protein
LNHQQKPRQAATRFKGTSEAIRSV